MDKTIDVSVYCLAYNHEKYIRKCLDGFVMQKGVRFEAIVHDDASMDNTAEIIREYAQKYPDIIKPICQKENQYSKGINIRDTYILPAASGKYLAICEGDDYWTDPYKLSKQFDYMEKHPQCGICVHEAVKHNCSTGADSLVTGEDCERDYSVDEIIIAGGGIFATNSAMVKMDDIRELPECFQAKGFGDYQLFMYGAIMGTCHYLPDSMSVYNCGTEGSWTMRVQKKREKRIDTYREMVRMLCAVDAYYDQKYHQPISKKTRDIEFKLNVSEGKFFQTISPRYKESFRAMRLRGENPLKECIAVKMSWLRHIKRKILNGK